MSVVLLRDLATMPVHEFMAQLGQALAVALPLASFEGTFAALVVFEGLRVLCRVLRGGVVKKVGF